MGESDRVPPTARADALTTTRPRRAEFEDETVERTSPIVFPLLSASQTPERETERRLVTASRASDERATLTVLTGMEAGQVYSLAETGCTIGREPGVEIVVDDQAVSRKHARILPMAGGFFIEDLQSTNGTFVSGTRVARVELSPGDRIQLGPNLVVRYTLIDGTEEALQRRLYESSTRDPLTGAFNRAYLGERLLAETSHARRHKSELTLLMIDLDAFKRVNDEHGHLAGDAVLQAVAQLLLHVVRVEDVLARYGGEEFVVLLRATTLDGAARLAERLRAAVSKERVAVDGKELSVTVSIGAAALSELPADQGATELLAVADARLYRAKIAGRNRVCSEPESPHAAG
jgi:diguanylate cyclase (GGDEF)-like protein